jgi:acyl-CoA thioester hydrolase
MDARAVLTPTAIPSESTEAEEEIWRGCSQAWECDEMGHQNVRFFVTQAMEGMAELLARLGIPTITRGAGSPAIVYQDQHIRFVRELRPGTAIHLVGGIVDLTTDGARIAQILYHSASGDVAAAFLSSVGCVGSDGASRNWPEDFVARAGVTPIPVACQPRGLSSPIGLGLPSSARADVLGMTQTGLGIVSDAACDRAGQMRTDQFIARISDATRLVTGVFHQAAAAGDGAPARIGSAGVEVRLRYFEHPRAGDRFVIRAGLAEVNERTRKTIYWMLDAATGRAFAALESLEVLLDLDSRRSFRLSPDATDALRAGVLSF